MQRGAPPGVRLQPGDGRHGGVQPQRRHSHLHGPGELRPLRPVLWRLRTARLHRDSPQQRGALERMRRLRPGGAVLSGPPQLGAGRGGLHGDNFRLCVPGLRRGRTEAESAAPTTAANALVTSADSKSYTYTFENVTEDHAISVTFEKPSP